MTNSDHPVRALVVANAYPSRGDLYRNGFIHRRVKAYQSAGLIVDVFYHHEPTSKDYTYDFDNVRVTVGNGSSLRNYVYEHKYDVFLVHFAEEGRVRPLVEVCPDTRIIVWIHGFEAEAWHRRWFNFIENPAELSTAISKRDNYYAFQNKFMRELVEGKISSKISFVHVSEWFKSIIVEPDIGTEFTNYEIIPNFVDQSLFKFNPKQPEDRLNILSVRPYASMKYANDLVAEAIIILSERPYFEQLNFTICGRGKLFDEITKPLRSLRNVQLRNRFFTQDEISKLHKKHGVFLSPTRFDSQGVSMCESMSSGLVPITTNTAAIPEFVDDSTSGLLTRPEDPESIADAVEELFFDESFFMELSLAASARSEAQCGYEATIQRELNLIYSKAG